LEHQVKIIVLAGLSTKAGSLKVNWTITCIDIRTN